MSIRIKLLGCLLSATVFPVVGQTVQRVFPVIEGDTVERVTQEHIIMKRDHSIHDYYGESRDMFIDDKVLESEDEHTHSVVTLIGEAENVYYNTASYNFGPMRFQYRGYENPYRSVYVNGVEMNDLISGAFDFASLGGMSSRAFRNRTISIGMDAASYGFGAIGGAINYDTQATGYAPGFSGSVAYTNSSYMLRAMATYSTGISRDGWGITVSGIGRWSNEGSVPGTFYKSGGIFVTIEKIFNRSNSLTLTAYGAPIQRSVSSATYKEVYELTGNNLYNPDWGWQNGKKRSSRIRQQFDPTFMFNWVYRPGKSTIVNTALMFRVVDYSQSRLEWHNAPDPMPTYYRNLPSYYGDDSSVADYYACMWKNDDSFRQINWNNLYQVNYLNNLENLQPDNENNQKGSSYILEDRHSNRNNIVFNSYVNHRFNDLLTLQGGVMYDYTRGSYFKTVRDLLGGEFWTDVESFGNGIVPSTPDLIQNDLEHPYRQVSAGDKFGYDYDIYAMRGRGWLQNTLNLPKWEIFYGIQADYTSYQRKGYMRSGRDPENSMGRGAALSFINAMGKAGVSCMPDGHNAFSLHVQGGSRAPLGDMVFLAPRYRAAFIDNPRSERLFSGDISYSLNYMNLRGYMSGYYTVVDNATERSAFYDDDYRSTVYYIMQGVKRVYKGVELGVSYKIIPSLTATLAGTFSRSQYKNNPTVTRVVDNGSVADEVNTVYLCNYFLGSIPQAVGNLGFDWVAPHNWFLNVNGTWMGNSYVTLSPCYHETLPDLGTLYPDPADLEAKIVEISDQEKLRDAFVLNMSIGKVVNVNRKLMLNFNLTINNLLNNRDIVTYAYEQSRISQNAYDRSRWPSRYQYAQGMRLFFNVGVRF